MEELYRIHLKPDAKDRNALIDFCLNGKEQYLVMGWSCLYENDTPPKTFDEYYEQVQKTEKRTPSVLNEFRDAKIDDLFWTRDLEGMYWICRVIGQATTYFCQDMDIGAVLPVEAFRHGMEVPGRIKASFVSSRTGQRVSGADILNYSKKIYNQLSKTDKYVISNLQGDILDNLPDKDLEELVISYIQLSEGYYLLSNSLANKSTTIKIECEFIKREKDNPQRAVVQVKSGKSATLDALDYQRYDEKGYTVYLYAPCVFNSEKLKSCIVIQKKELKKFYDEYRTILPDNITVWEKL